MIDDWEKCEAMKELFCFFHFLWLFFLRFLSLIGGKSELFIKYMILVNCFEMMREVGWGADAKPWA